MLRWTVASAMLFVCTACLAGDDLSVFVNEDDHFVLSSSGTELVGVQLESESGSIIPDPSGDTGPFQLQMRNDANVVMFGSLGVAVRVDGALVLPTRWDTNGNNDVGFLWGSMDDQGFGAVEGHSPTFLTKVPSTEPVEPIRQQDVAAVVVVQDSESPSSGEFPGVISLFPLTADGRLEVHVFDNPEIDFVTIKSNAGLLAPLSDLDPSVFSLVTQDAFQATFTVPETIADGVYPLPLLWSGGTEFMDLGLEVDVPLSQPLPFVEIETAVSRALPEPSSVMILLWSALMLLPTWRRVQRIARTTRSHR